jgi:RNA polymerase sigma-70 factor (ECF subfamily)
MNDQQIVELYWQRDAAAIQETSKKYGAYCYAIANNILNSKEDSEECVNDTWLKTWNAIPPQRPALLQMFLAKITRNLSLDRFLARTAQKRGGGEMPLVLDELSECIPSSSDVASEYERKELAQYIRKFVHSLPERERNIFLRRYFYANSIADIATRYGLSENNVTVILSRTRKKLKLRLQKEGFNNG